MADARYEVRLLPDSDPRRFGIYDLQDDAWLERPHDSGAWSTHSSYFAATLTASLNAGHRREAREADRV